MGKMIIAALCALLMAEGAYAKKPKLARMLPSEVKTIHLPKPAAAPKKKAKKMKARSAAHAAKEAAAASLPGLSDFAPELQEQARNNPEASKYFSRTVYYFHSDEVLPSSYNCDESIEESKKMEAQSQAESKCSAQGGEDCHVAGVVISKSGVLRCQDFPGRHCPARGHYRGCVAEALVLGERHLTDLVAGEN